MNPETGLPIEKKTRKPRTVKPKAELKGYTKVAEGTDGIVDAARKWTKDQVEIQGNAMFVQNEFINWQAFRDQDVLIPASEGVTRSAAVPDPSAIAPALDANGMPIPQVA